MKKIINSDKAPAPIGPYNHSVMTGDLLFISGQIPFNQATETLVTTGIEDEAKQVMANLEAILEAAGMTFENVVKATIFLTDMNDFATVNQVYGSHFSPASAPARECIQVVKLPRNVNVEISMIASK
ncbi:Rid family detoxifying hydrolase [Myroides pelagicus]|uniref:RidA family protein n=1 Tax=Myroides pelagicus TaxID=270914 RepID=A0A7K1GK08_9FLAO|nr:Rid family detoxifying hydrolase [Myroides pelagicus]MEC4114051.1 Rid family detoxifying hydrolase [Myroides pelagicus]MTH29212.1 RidA family protein [Myroides pelagicus]